MAKRMHRETTGNIRNLPYYIDNTVSQEMNNKYFKTVVSLALQGFFFFFFFGLNQVKCIEKKVKLHPTDQANHGLPASTHLCKI
jgi:hypothetical protein